MADDQYLLLPASDAFLKRVDYVDSVASAWRPHSEPKSPVRMNPRQRFGQPAIKGVSTVTYPGDPGGVLHKRERPPCPVDKVSMLDEEWIPLVAAQGWLIITRDARIQHHVA